MEESVLDRDQFLPAMGLSTVTVPLSRKLWPSSLVSLGHICPEGVGLSNGLAWPMVCVHQIVQVLPSLVLTRMQGVALKVQGTQKCLPAQIPCPGKPNRKLAG